jgi:hypothetical protein
MVRLSLHDKGVLNLEARLKEYGYKTKKFVEYKKRGMAGELDVVAFRRGRCVYYEYKSRDCPQAWNRAVKQFERANKALTPQYDMRFVYVTPTRIARYKPNGNN